VPVLLVGKLLRHSLLLKMGGTDKKDYLPLASVPASGKGSSDDAKRYSGDSAMIACIANLSNTIMGAGMLGLPAAFAGAGNVMGCIILVVAACFSANGLYLLTLCAERVGITKEVRSRSVGVLGGPRGRGLGAPRSWRGGGG
jgi:hypothetical protein